MADKLTKAQKDLLQLMRDNPDWYIGQYTIGYEYNLYRTDYNKVKRVKNDWMRDWTLLPFFQQVTDARMRIYKYTLRPDAELTEAWRDAELERERQAKQAEKDAKEQAIRAEKVKAELWFNGRDSGPYTVSFYGEYFTGSGSIYCGDNFITSFSLIYQGSDDKTFEAMMKRPENLAHFTRIREMLRRANRPE